MRASVAFLACVAIGGTGWAQERPRPSPEPLTSVLERLGSPDYKTREAAQRVLESYGPEHLAALRKALESTTSAEIRKRLGSRVQAHERNEILGPKRLTLHMVNQPLAEVVKEIVRQTGYQIQNQSGNNPKISIDAENQTFWEVLDRVCLAAGLTVYHNEGQGMVLSYNDYFTPVVVYRDTFKIVPNNFSYNKTINFGPLPRNPLNHQSRHESLSFAFTISAEPKLPIMTVGQPRILEAVDDQGRSMAPAQPPHESNYYSYSGYRTYQYGTSVNLNWVHKDSRVVKRLRVSVPVTLLAHQKPEIVVDDLPKVKKQKYTGANSEILIEEFKEPNKGQYHIKLTARNTAASAAHDYSWANSIPQRMEVFDAKGRKLFQQGYNYENSSPTHLQATFMYGTNGDATIGTPHKLVYNHWGMMQHQIDFEFKDLPLP